MYTVKVLSDKEFNRLPYRLSGQALGVADPKKNTAYVRYTAHPNFQRFLVNHEFDHLIEEIPTDEIEGVRYFLGGILGSLGNLLKFGGQKVLPFLQQAGGYAKKAVGAMNPFGTFGQQTPSAKANFLPGMAMMGGKQVPVNWSGAGAGANNAFYKMSGNAPSQGAFSMFNNPQTKGGLAMMGMSRFMPTPKMPGLPVSADELRQRTAQGVDLSSVQLTPEEEAAILRPLERQKQDAMEALKARYRNLQPGSDPESNSAFKKDMERINAEYDPIFADALTNATSSRRGQRLQEITTDVNQRAMIAQMDIDQIMAQYGLDYQSAYDLKSQVSQLGMYTAMQGMSGGFNPFSMFADMFK